MNIYIYDWILNRIPWIVVPLCLSISPYNGCNGRIAQPLLIPSWWEACLKKERIQFGSGKLSQYFFTPGSRSFIHSCALCRWTHQNSFLSLWNFFVCPEDIFIFVVQPRLDSRGNPSVCTKKIVVVNNSIKRPQWRSWKGIIGKLKPNCPTSISFMIPDIDYLFPEMHFLSVKFDHQLAWCWWWEWVGAKVQTSDEWRIGGDQPSSVSLSLSSWPNHQSLSKPCSLLLLVLLGSKCNNEKSSQHGQENPMEHQILPLTHTSGAYSTTQVEHISIQRGEGLLFLPTIPHSTMRPYRMKGQNMPKCHVPRHSKHG